MNIKTKERKLLLGFARVLVVTIAIGLAMKLAGYYEQDKWILKLNLAVLPWYFVYKIYIKPEYQNN
jgi:hypothetical protein